MSLVGVYRMYKLARISGNLFSAEMGKQLERDLHVITNVYADQTNENSHINGLLYEKDEKATELYLAGKPFKQVKEYTSFEEVKPKGRKPKKMEELDVNNVEVNDQEEVNNED